MSDKYPGGFVTANAPAGFSVAFDGTGDYLSMASGTSLGAGNFTIECWVYLTAAPAGETTVGSSSDYYTAGFNGNFVFRVGTTNLWRSFDAQSNQATIDGTFTWSTGQWYHMAWVRNSGTVTVYRNGTSLGSVADSKTLSDSTNGYAVAATKSGGSYSSLLTGYISNLRVVVGTALYTTTFTPPTQLLNISGTSLLTCNSPTIIDQSTNAYAITANGDAKVSNFTPFAAYQGFNPALGAAAGGVWTLDEAAYYQNNRQWPIYDPYFNQTTLMLHGNGTNAAQNNTFLDSSTNNFTITRNGNTTQGSFSPFSQTGWSNNFVSSAALSVDYTANLQLQNTNWTIESYFNLSSASAEFCVMGASNGGGGVPKYFMGGNWSTAFGYNANRATFFTYTAGGNRFIDVPFTWEIGRWYHMAAVYTHSNTTVTLYINGVSVGSIAYGIDSCTGAVLIARNGEGGGILTGYISNFRYIVGTSLYTSNFTPSTAPLTATTNTQILTCQSNRFVDNSASNRVINIFAAGVSVQAFSPFVPAYITPTTYSNYFNGSSSYLYVVSSALNVPSSTDFTIEGWVYLNAHTNNQPCIFNNYTSVGGLALFAGHNSFDANLFNLLIAGNIYSGGTIVYGKWTHFAVVRNGTGSGNVSLYINGISVLSTISTNAAITYTGQVSIGTAGDSTSAGAINGCISNFRWNTTTAVYTASFTPPTAPLTAISGTQLLTCQSSTFIDNSTNNLTLTAAGTVQPVTSPTPFPAKVDTTTLNSAYSTSLIGGSGYFDGTTDYLSFTDPSNTLDLGGRAASIEAWIYPTSTAGAQHFLVKTGGDFSWNTTSGIEYAIAFDVNKFYFVYNVSGTATFINGATTRSRNQWYHVVVATDASNNIALFVNGVRDGTATNAISKPTNRTLMYVGANSGGTETLTGYISGERFISGSGAYDPTKTVVAFPTTPPTAISGTQLLLNYTNGAIFDNTAKNVLETVGNAQISTTQSKWGGSSMYFDGTGDYLLLQAGPNLALGAGDFTIEMWFYVTTTAAVQALIDFRPASTDGVYPLIYISSGGTSIILDVSAGTRITGTTTISTNTWYHFALSRSGTSTKMFVNGTQVGSTYTDSNSYLVGTNRPVIAANGFTLGNNPLTGYIDDLRITKGVARYLTNFTPPTSQLQDQ